MNYATLTELRSYLGLAASETADDSRLTSFLNWSTKQINSMSRRCDVRRETHTLDHPGEDTSLFKPIDSPSDFISALTASNYYTDGRLKLGDDLLSVETLTNGDATVILASKYLLLPNNLTPKHSIQLRVGSGVTWMRDDNGGGKQCISLLGLWGWHDDYSNAWVDSVDTVQDSSLSVGATSLTVANESGIAADLDTPRFQVGHMLQIGSEFLYVTAVNTTTHVLTVIRGYNGTVAVAHDKNTKIYLYRPADNVKMAAIRLATWRYRQKDANVFDRTTILQTGVVITPSAVPVDIQVLLPDPRIEL